MAKELLFTPVHELAKTKDGLSERFAKSLALLDVEDEFFKTKEKSAGFMQKVYQDYRLLKDFMIFMSMASFGYGCNTDEFYKNNLVDNAVAVELKAEATERINQTREIKVFCQKHGIKKNGTYDYLDNLAIDEDGYPQIRFIGDSAVIIKLAGEGGQVEYFAANFNRAKTRGDHENIKQNDLGDSETTNNVNLFRLRNDKSIIRSAISNLQKEYRDVGWQSSSAGDVNIWQVLLNPEGDKSEKGARLWLFPDGRIYVDYSTGPGHPIIERAEKMAGLISEIVDVEKEFVSKFEIKRPNLPSHDEMKKSRSLREDLRDEVEKYKMACEVARLHSSSTRYDIDMIKAEIQWANNMLEEIMQYKYGFQ